MMGLSYHKQQMPLQQPPSVATCVLLSGNEVCRYHKAVRSLNESDTGNQRLKSCSEQTSRCCSGPMLDSLPTLCLWTYFKGGG